MDYTGTKRQNCNDKFNGVFSAPSLGEAHQCTTADATAFRT